ncbi:Tetracenomycin polyketide synthesis O-methyltransferase tcmP [Lysobacter capsici AZ78]|uniref:Tetracenomycin polyketide synthesis O-methyltransferase tcmP n=1 Tax=Lysobacter capsici AZ78 TaxID=1444315 RepID=A0A120AHI4_9GAMM|nr:class I SAM-dependent methyltransferase [Lysobacter capsici]KWS06248.1 Tetracenomycin polyketide synthesis O-methyltransferase tcmP [Lysobacter capsici AZ78]
MRLEGSQETLLITLYAKAMDNRATPSILHDALADDLIRRIDYDFERFGLSDYDIRGLALRSRIIDNWTRAALQSRPDTLVLHLACGLDARVFRVDPSLDVDWIDIDFPPVIQLRRDLLPQRLGRYRTLATNVIEPDWIEKLDNQRPVLVIAEGLFPYLDEYRARELMRRLIERFPQGGQLLCDVYGRLALRVLRNARMIRATQARIGEWGRPARRNWKPGIRACSSSTNRTMRNCRKCRRCRGRSVGCSSCMGVRGGCAVLGGW